MYRHPGHREMARQGIRGQGDGASTGKAQQERPKLLIQSQSATGALLNRGHLHQQQV